MYKLKGETIVVGDIHGNPASVLKYRDTILSVRKQIKNVILLGDVGFGFMHKAVISQVKNVPLADLEYVNHINELDLEKQKRLFFATKKSSRILVEDIMSTFRLLTGNKDIKVFAIRGNHDDPGYWDKDSSLWLSAKKVEKNFHFVGDEFIDINGYLWLCIGGSVSIDRFSLPRVEGASWWPGEEMNHNFDKPLPIGYEQVTGILSHSGVRPPYAEWKSPTQFEGEIQEALKLEEKTIESLAVRYNPKFWFYGHFHESWRKSIPGEMLLTCVGSGEVRLICIPVLEASLEIPLEIP